MTSIHATAALLGAGWAENVRFVMEGARIRSIETATAPRPDDERHDVVVPGLANVHSHAFQRAMAGLAETRGPANDSFWTWRKVMYDFTFAFDPEAVEAVAAQLYIEMLEAGFTRVGEFHYLHHDRDGRPYADIAEHAVRIAAAAQTSGIGLTLLPVFYAHSNFGGATPSEGQKRFINTLDSFATLMERCETIIAALPEGRLGLAPHSLRAVTPDELAQILPLAKDGPIHIHVAEQTKEVDDCLAWSGARPMEWLLDNAPVDERWTLIHATHMTETETSAMARRKAVAGLCPITEANLGDGFFPATPFLNEGGAFGIGSDSNVQITLSGELRQLEYAQRLLLRSRNVIAHPGESTGRRLFEEALAGGCRSLRGSGPLDIGARADMVSLSMAGVPGWTVQTILDHWIFGAGVGVDTVWVGGRKRVSNGRHLNRDRIFARFSEFMRSARSNP